ncbi:TIGR01777 family oxidoreductase [Alkalihalobacterium bogoriense]|uniref:TIGR01777 family oxidoreductase n=1 Tax=Alkalihalobacterium bogoriense TaxID=246272 RepID=UPI00047C831B|nr:TIGR01777 family oxidoreductase [Alkalihalobacterium bogoriense]
MTKKIVIAGGTGFIGQYFEKQWRNNGYDVKIISRQPQHISWDDHTALVEAVNEAELLINLAGKSVNCRYNEKNKQEIMGSRVRTTKLLGEVIKQCEHPPKLWVNSSTATIYRHAEDRAMTEEKGELGSGFSVDVAKAWEEAFFSFDLPKTRQIALRIAIVLGKGGGVMTPYQNLVKFGLGGAQGKGNQKFSWIHVEDLYQIVLFLQDREDLSGVFNGAAPNPVTNRELMKHMRTAMNRSFGLPAPKWMLELGAVFIKTETELVLKSRWVLPERLQQEGYQFKFDTLEKTLDHIVS